jgi:hypothetical protein
MTEENRRLVERERLDVAPTTVLGLFVVGRLARRHGLSVRLDPTPGQGVTATVKVPRRLLARRATPAGVGGAVQSPPPQVIEAPRRPLGTLAAALTRPADEFPWFVHHGHRAVELTAGPARPPSPPAPAPPEVPPVGVSGPGEWPPPPPPLPGTASVHGGLTRRTPGQHLSELAEPPLHRRHAFDPQAPRRDAEAEREELDDFIDGLRRARPTPPSTNPDPSTGEPR